MLQHAFIAFVVAVVLAPFSYYMGLGARQLKLPQITGYLISGIVCGPYVLNLLNHESVSDLSILEGACLSIIGLAAGAELHLSDLQKSKKQVLYLSVSICVFSWAYCYVAFAWAGRHVAALSSLDSGHVQAIATLGATIMMARSPASAIAVMKELDAKGPFSSLVMAVVVLKDVIVIVIFALNVELIPVVFLPAAPHAAFDGRHLLLPVMSVALSVCSGIVGGLALSVLLSPLLPLSAFLPQPHMQSRARVALVLVMSSCTFQLTRLLDAEPLLSCVTMGMLLVNMRHDKGEQFVEELTGMISEIMSLTNVAFFGLAGASLKLSALVDMLWMALLVFAVRLLALYHGSAVGCRLSGATPECRRLFWQSMITQAGVAMGLARIAGTKFPGWGPHFQTLTVSIVIVNMLVGPPAFRRSLLLVGEARGTAALALGKGHSEQDEFLPDDDGGTLRRKTIIV